MVPMAPSSTRIRSAAKRRSAFSALDIAAGLRTATARYQFPLPNGEREDRLGPHPEQVANRIDQVGAVHGVKMKIGDAVVDEIENLLGSDRGGNQFAGRWIVFDTVETLGEP